MFRVNRLQLIGVCGLVVGALGFVAPVIVAPLPSIETSGSNSDEIERPFNMDQELWQKRLDLSGIPAPRKTELKVVEEDPAQALQGWRLAGVVINENEAIALLAGPTGLQSLRQGDILSEFTLSSIAARAVTFSKEDVEVDFSIPQKNDG